MRCRADTGEVTPADQDFLAHLRETLDQLDELSDSSGASGAAVATRTEPGSGGAQNDPAVLSAAAFGLELRERPAGLRERVLESGVKCHERGVIVERKRALAMGARHFELARRGVGAAAHFQSILVPNVDPG